MCKFLKALLVTCFLFLFCFDDNYASYFLFSKSFDTDDIAATCAKNASAAAKEGLKDLVQVFALVFNIFVEF